jgi:hypothetical protein
MLTIMIVAFVVGLIALTLIGVSHYVFDVLRPIPIED